MNKENIAEIIKEKGYAVEFRTVNKNGVVKEAISISPVGAKVSPVLYLDNYDFDGNTDEETAVFLIEAASPHFMDNDAIDANEFIKIESVKDKLRVGLRPVHLDNYGDSVITRRRFDMEEYLYISVEIQPGQIGSIKVTEEIFDTWKVGVLEIFALAEMNTFKECQYEDMRVALMGMLPEEVADNLPPASMYIISNKNRTNGAIAMLSTNILAEIADQFENDVYILPSSIHEVLAISGAEVKNVSDLIQMVYEVNTHEVEPAERLSYSVFFFDRENRQLSKVEA